jgi:hypothetical protein
MPLAGTFSTMPFPDLLQWVNDARRTGSLSVSLEFEERFLRIEEGQITAVESDDPRAQDIARTLKARGQLNEAQLAQATATAASNRLSFSDALVKLGYMKASEVDELTRDHAVQIVLGLFLWRDGRFHFSEGDSAILRGAVAARPLSRPIDIREMLMEGMRRLDEWQRIVEVFPSDFCQVHAIGRADELPILDELLTRGEPVALGELWAQRGAERYRIYEQLFQAVQRGLLAVDTTVAVQVAPSDAAPVDTLVRSALVLVDERQWEEAATLLRSALDLDPFRTDARDLLRRARDEQLAELYQTIPPFKVPVLAVSRERLQRLNLTARELHVAERINGRWDVGALVVVTPVGELETMRVLKKLIHLGAMRFTD